MSRDGSEYYGLKEFAPWGPPWHKEKVLTGYKTAYDHEAESRILSHFAHEAMDHIGTIRSTLQQPNYPAGCFDCEVCEVKEVETKASYINFLSRIQLLHYKTRCGM